MAPRPLLAGDVGGTNARLSLLSPDGRRVLRRATLPSRSFASLEAAIAEFLAGERAAVAAIGVAGPVAGGRCQATNLPWIIDERVLERRLGLSRAKLANDLVAAAFGALAAPASRVRLVQGKSRPKKRGGSIAILAAGTGLGEAALIWDGARHVPLATEGGHVDFAPRSEREARLLAFMQKRLGKRVSYERILSGNGLGALYDFFAGPEGMRDGAPVQSALGAAPDRNALISELGLAKKSRAARAAVELFLALLGAEAGNLALKTLPAAGLFVSGNIGGALLRGLGPRLFLEAFLDKGRMTPLLRAMPVAFLTDTDVGLRGAMRLARDLSQA